MVSCLLSAQHWLQYPDFVACCLHCCRTIISLPDCITIVRREDMSALGTVVSVNTGAILEDAVMQVVSTTIEY